MAKTHIVEFVQSLPISLDQAWGFFSAPKNLERITPPDMRFEILSKDVDRPIFNGMRIAYRVRPLLGIPAGWLTEIRNVEAPYLFTDAQLKGPFKKWIHTHRFEATPTGVLMRDKVEYELPWGPLGEIAHALFVRKRVENIFTYREVVLRTIFAST